MTKDRITKPGIPVPMETRGTILEDAKRQILEGKTLAQIAEQHGIATRTLEYWLASLGDEYRELRRVWLDGMLHEAGEELKHANDPLRLARARELWKRATWYAERLDRARYGQETARVAVVAVDLGERLRRARERVIEHQPAALPPAEEEEII
jgi:transposase-like protein